MECVPRHIENLVRRQVQLIRTNPSRASGRLALTKDVIPGELGITQRRTQPYRLPHGRQTAHLARPAIYHGVRCNWVRGKRFRKAECEGLLCVLASEKAPNYAVSVVMSVWKGSVGSGLTRICRVEQEGLVEMVCRISALRSTNIGALRKEKRRVGQIGAFTLDIMRQRVVLPRHTARTGE